VFHLISRVPRARVVGLCIGGALLIGAPSSGAAQDAAARSASPLTFDRLRSLVAERSPRRAAAQALARAAEARIGPATRPPDPQLQVGLMNYALPQLGPDPILGMQQLQLMQMIPTAGKLQAATRAARARADAVGARGEEVAWQVWSEAAMAYFEHWQVDSTIHVMRETRRLLEDVASVATAMYRVGEGRQSDVLRARVEIARMDEEIVRMTTMRTVASTRLASLLDTTTASVESVGPRPAFPAELPSVDSLERLALRARPMLRAGAADLRAAESDALLARRERWPDLTVGLQYGQRGMDGGIDRMGSLMVGAALPVFARSRQQRMQEEARAMQQMANAEFAAMRADTRARIAAQHALVASTRRLRALYRDDILPQAEAGSTSALAAYRTGGVDFMTVIENRMGVNRFRQELLALDAAEGRAWTELEMLVGQVLLTGGSR
jgi:outer membrane protein, heavy metal efflux system